MTKTTKIITYIAIVLAVITVIGVVAHFTNGFTSDFKTFYVTVDGKDVMTSAGGYRVTTSKPLEVDVKYTFGALNNKVDKDYSLKIIPNNIPDKDFTYTVDDEMKYFQSETDLSEGFEIDKGEKSFRIKPKGETISEVLSAVYGKSITDCESKGYTNMFTVIVTSYNGEASVKLDFSLAIRVAGITLDKEAILF
ncbi:MAG: hypothetical protein SO003_01245 [Candidatus Borkfalkiaceae bacterium]|nr:hypothetical protein [Christensenellaceae bacterium]